MSEENVEIVRRGFDAWEEGDLTGVLGLMAEDFVIRRHPPLPDPNTWEGREGLLQVAVEWGEIFGDYTVKAEELIDAGSHVIVRVFQKGRGAEGGTPVTGAFWWTIELRDERAVAIDICHNPCAGPRSRRAVGVRHSIDWADSRTVCPTRGQSRPIVANHSGARSPI